MVSDIVFALSRISTAILSLVTFLIGLSKNEKSEEIQEGDYNTPLVRFGSFLAVGALQIYLLFFFVKEHITQLKEMKIPITSLLKQPSSQQTTDENGKFTPKKRKGKFSTFAILIALKIRKIILNSFLDRKSIKESHLTEADQNLKRNIRSKKPKAK